MKIYERTDGNQFLYTQINQKEIDVLDVYAYASYWLLPEKLQIAANGGIYRCFNFGYDYTQFYPSANIIRISSSLALLLIVASLTSER